MDGIDAALVSFRESSALVESYRTYPYSEALASQLHTIRSGDMAPSLDQLGQIDRQLGIEFGRAAITLLSEANVSASEVIAIGSHGQTIRHRTDVANPFSMQLADPNTIAAETGITTIADFRRADLALAGEGAPLAPAFHYWLSGYDLRNSGFLNLGGIANLTSQNKDGDVIGFDCGPASTLLDATAVERTGHAFDHNGNIARQGLIDEVLLAGLLGDQYFSLAPPKSTGFEYFNRSWLDVKTSLSVSDISTNDLLATLTELTARSAADALLGVSPDCKTLYICGGGVHNGFLCERLRAALPQVNVVTTAALGVHPDCVEAAAFAWLARERLAGRPANIPTVTGARRPAVLGGIYSA